MVNEELIREMMGPLVAEVKNHHPELWAQVHDLHPLKCLPFLNEYCGTQFDQFQYADEVIDGLVEALKQRRSLS